MGDIFFLFKDIIIESFLDYVLWDKNWMLFENKIDWGGKFYVIWCLLVIVYF